ncbi:hypothetical protein BJV78DRAFT_951763 [Lactifluus subvellereus]|nr:hypothetical protein BJV78DRAFT_951763 [Lactifluus subvellereus]
MSHRHTNPPHRPTEPPHHPTEPPHHHGTDSEPAHSHHIDPPHHHHTDPPDHENLDEWLHRHHHIVHGLEAGDGDPVHVFAQANGPIFGHSKWWHFTVHWLFWSFSWGLQGLIDLSTLIIDATLSIHLPILGTTRLISVKGPLTGNGVRVSFNIGIVKGDARFYAVDRWLWVQMTVTELVHRPTPPVPATRTVRLLHIPLTLPHVQSEYVNYFF